MTRRVGQGTVTTPRNAGEVITAPQPKPVPGPGRAGFEPGSGKPQVTLQSGNAKPERVNQRAVFDVVPQHPDTVNAALAKLDLLPGVVVQKLGEIDGIAVQVARVSGSPGPAGTAPKRVLITGGVHGSEPAGAISAVEVLELVAKHPGNFAGYEFAVIPLVNPEGFRDGTRHNENDHVDLNREVEPDGSVPKEIALVLPVLDEGPWALALDLHASGSTTSTGKNGFFAIRTQGNDALLHDVMSEFAKTHPVLDETTQRYSMIEPGVMESQNLGTVKGYLFANGTKAAFTLEAPALGALKSQVDGLVDLVQGFLKHAA